MDAARGNPPPAGTLNIIDRDSCAVLMRIALLSSPNGADITANLGFRCVRDLERTPWTPPLLRSRLAQAAVARRRNPRPR